MHFISKLDDDCLEAILYYCVNSGDLSLEKKFQLSHVCRRWRPIVLFLLRHQKFQLGLKSQSFPSCPDYHHTVPSNGLISPFFRKVIPIEGRLYRKIQQWKLRRVIERVPNVTLLSLSPSLISIRLAYTLSLMAPHLIHLDLSKCRGLNWNYVPESIKSTMTFPCLKHLNLRSTDVSDCVAGCLLKSCRNLQAVSISGDCLTGTFLKELPLSVKTLAFGGKHLTSDILDSLTILTLKSDEDKKNDIRHSLSELKLIDLDAETIDPVVKTGLLQRVCEIFVYLKSLVFKNCGVSSFNFPLLDIRNLTHMEVLRVVDNNTEDIIFGDMAILNMVERMKNLMFLQLDLVAWNLHTDPKHVFESMSKSCPNLKYLSIRKWISLKAQSVVYLSSLKSLVYIDIGQISYFNKINLHGEVIELLTDLSDGPLKVLRLNTHFPDNDRFASVLLVATILSKRRKTGNMFQLDLPLYSKEYEPSSRNFTPPPTLSISHYDHFYNCVPKYLVDRGVKF